MSHLHYVRVCRKSMNIWLKGNWVSAIFSQADLYTNRSLQMQFSTQTINSTYARKQKATSVMILHSPIFIQEFASRHQLFIENSKFILIDPFIHWDKNILGTLQSAFSLEVTSFMRTLRLYPTWAS